MAGLSARLRCCGFIALVDADAILGGIMQAKEQLRDEQAGYAHVPWKTQEAVRLTRSLRASAGRNFMYPVLEENGEANLTKSGGTVGWYPRCRSRVA